MKKFLALTMTMVLCTSFLTACASAPTAPVQEETVIEETVAPEAETTETTETTEEAPAQSEAIADGVLRVGTNAEFPPFEYVNDQGEPDGFDIALIKAIGDKMGVEVQVENMEFPSLVSSIGTKIDVAIAGMTVTEERMLAVDFSNTYYDAVQFVVVMNDSTIATKEDLVGKKIGVQLGTTGDFLTEDIEDAEVSQYNKAVDAVNDLINGRVECVIVDKNPAMVFDEKFAGQVKALDGAAFEFGVEQYAIAMPKGDVALADAINKALEEIKADGTFDQLVSQYMEAN